MRPFRLFRSNIRKGIVLALLLASALLLTAAEAEPVSFKNIKDALNYLKTNQPEEVTMEPGKYKPLDLLSVKNAMPEGSVLHFSTTWGNASFTDESETVDLTQRKGGVSGEDLEAIVRLCPKVKCIDNSTHTSPSNKVMIPLVEKYPDIEFGWKVSLGKGYYVSTMATAYSSFNSAKSGMDKKLTTDKMELFKYCPKLKALDLGHHAIGSLDFLKYLPDLELLIIGQNYVKDITPIGQLKHLQYAELFLNAFTDVSPLANCTELLDLNLTATSITDLSALDNVTTLERLVVNMCKYLPQEAVDHFKELHPTCEVDYKPSHSATNTEKPWRKHPRYKHYIWCLKHGTWIPFNEEIPAK